MNLVEMFSRFREHVGNPGVDAVSERQITEYVTDAFYWLADQLQQTYTADQTTLQLVAGQFEYPLPDNVSQVVRVDWNDQPLTPASTYKWDREETPWRHGTAGRPAEFAIEGRRLILYPPPDAGNIATAGYLHYRYLAATSGLDEGGAPGVVHNDQVLAVCYAALLYLRARPTEENLPRQQGLEKTVKEWLAGALRRAHTPSLRYEPQVSVMTRRQFPAR